LQSIRKFISTKTTIFLEASIKIKERRIRNISNHFFHVHKSFKPSCMIA
jgi:hypothetical protein